MGDSEPGFDDQPTEVRTVDRRHGDRRRADRRSYGKRRDHAAIETRVDLDIAIRALLNVRDLVIPAEASKSEVERLHIDRMSQLELAERAIAGVKRRMV